MCVYLIYYRNKSIIIWNVIKVLLAKFLIFNSNFKNLDNNNIKYVLLEYY